jgi:hypothetical protein
LRLLGLRENQLAVLSESFYSFSGKTTCDSNASPPFPRVLIPCGHLCISGGTRPRAVH